MKKKLKKQGFTLVELIIVIAIIAVLAVAAFMMLTKWLGKSRDSRRLGDLGTIARGLQVGYNDTEDGINMYPTVKDQEGSISLMSGSDVIGYQGVVDNDVASAASMQKAPKDPTDQSYYTYVVTQNRQKFQVLGFLEDGTAVEAILSNAYALDYSDRISTTKGFELGVVLEKDTNLPANLIEGLTGLDLMDETKTIDYKAIVSDTNAKIGTGLALAPIVNEDTIVIEDTSAGVEDEGEELICPEGFILVSGNATFNTTDFCVAKYEMSYDYDGTITTSTTSSSTITAANRETINYIAYGDTRVPVSKAGNLPIGNINQTQAITECASMGEGYHLITNEERMTIARDIEATATNWSAGSVGNGNIWNGISNGAAGCSGNGDGLRAEPSGSSCGVEQRNKHVLSNGEEIWDFSGNLWEHVNKANTIDGTGYNIGANPAVVGGSGWGEWSSSSESKKDLYGPATAVNSSDGIGMIYQGSKTIFLRGGDSYSPSYAGIFALALGWDQNDQSSNVGFRCAK